MKTWTCPLCHARPMPFDVLAVKRKPRWMVTVRCQSCGASMAIAKKGILWLRDKHGTVMTIPDAPRVDALGITRWGDEKVPF